MNYSEIRRKTRKTRQIAQLDRLHALDEFAQEHAHELCNDPVAGVSQIQGYPARESHFAAVHEKGRQRLDDPLNFPF